MRIKNQFLISIIVFSLVFLIIVGSIILTQQQIDQLNSKEAITTNIQTGAGDLGYLSDNYFLYRDNSQLTQWYLTYSALSSDISKLTSNVPTERTLINNVKADSQRLNAVFNDSVSILQNIPFSQSARANSAFQTQWSRMAVQNQALAFDSQQLSQAFRNQIDQLNTTNILLIVAFLGLFGAYLITNYVITYRSTLRSIAKLQKGIKAIGSGNLNYSLGIQKKDEIGELSQSFNQMTTDLKAVTASKTALEKEIGERKKAEEALKQSEQSYHQLFSSMTEMFQVIELIYDKDGKAIDYYYRIVNSAFEKLVGKTREQLIDKRVKDLFAFVEDYWLEAYDKVAKTGNPAHFENYGAELEKWHEIYAWKANDKQIAITFTDITERKQAEEKLSEYRENLEKLVEERTKQLKDSERLATIGATAGMVGHDIRNPLQAITGDIYLVKSDLASMPECEGKQTVQESLTEIEKNVDYINKIVADLQDFARPLNPRAEEADLKQIIDDLLSKNGLPENVKVSVKVETEKVVADSTFINRIMYNLVNNAVQAMPKGGKLTIQAYKEANDVVITVKDTGVGITELEKAKLFTPMFTTKSKGQCFGLAVVKRITSVKWASK